MNINKRISNESTPTRSIDDISLIVHHHTASAGDSENFLKRDDYVSCHYLIKKSGEIVQLVDLDRVAYHAGVSNYEGLEAKGNSLNWCSVGIEVEGGAKGKDVDDFTDSQRTSLSFLTGHLKGLYGIQKVLRHKDISPDRKVDPYDTLYHGKFEQIYNNDKMSNNSLLPTDWSKLMRDEVDILDYTVGHNAGKPDEFEEKLRSMIELMMDRKVKKLLEKLNKNV